MIVLVQKTKKKNSMSYNLILIQFFIFYLLMSVFDGLFDGQLLCSQH